MSKKDRQKVSILVVLLGVLGLTLVLAYRMNKPASTAAVQSPETKPAPSAQTATDAKIRLDELCRRRGHLQFRSSIRDSP